MASSLGLGDASTLGLSKNIGKLAADKDIQQYLAAKRGHTKSLRSTLSTDSGYGSVQTSSSSYVSSVPDATSLHSGRKLTLSRDDTPSVNSPSACDDHDHDSSPESKARSILQCSVCGQQTQTYSLLVKHEARHRRQFMCVVHGCARGVGFATVNDLNRHLKAVHGFNKLGSRDYKCFAQGCTKSEKIWPRPDNFKAHIQRMHPWADVKDLLRKSNDWFDNTSPRELGCFNGPAAKFIEKAFPTPNAADSLGMLLLQGKDTVVHQGSQYTHELQEAVPANNNQEFPSPHSRKFERSLDGHEGATQGSMSKSQHYERSHITPQFSGFEFELFPYTDNLGSQPVVQRFDSNLTPLITVQPPTAVSSPQPYCGRPSGPHPKHDKSCTRHHVANPPTVGLTSHATDSLQDPSTMSEAPSTNQYLEQTRQIDSWGGSYGSLENEPSFIARMRSAVAQLSATPSSVIEGQYNDDESEADGDQEPPRKQVATGGNGQQNSQAQANFSSNYNHQIPGSNRKQRFPDEDGDRPDQSQGNKSGNADKDNAAEQAKRYFACPFFKHDHIHFAACQAVKYESVDGLYRHHLLTDHMFWGHLSKEISKDLRALKRQSNPAGRWYAIYQCIFKIPLSMQHRIPNPYWLPMLSTSNVDTLVSAAIIVTGAQTFVPSLPQHSSGSSNDLVPFHVAVQRINTLVDQCQAHEQAQAQQRWNLVKQQSLMALSTGQLPNSLMMTTGSGLPVEAQQFHFEHDLEQSHVQDPALQGVAANLASSSSRPLNVAGTVEVHTLNQADIEDAQAIDLPYAEDTGPVQAMDYSHVPAAVPGSAHEIDPSHRRSAHRTSPLDSGYASLETCFFLPDAESGGCCQFCRKSLQEHSAKTQRQYEEMSYMNFMDSPVFLGLGPADE